jgi:ankyrin repeat protein
LNASIGSKFASTNCTNYLQDEKTALMWAAESGHENVVDLLITEGAAVDYEDKVRVHNSQCCCSSCAREFQPLLFGGNSLAHGSAHTKSLDPDDVQQQQCPSPDESSHVCRDESLLS